MALCCVVTTTVLKSIMPGAEDFDEQGWKQGDILGR